MHARLLPLSRRPAPACARLARPAYAARTHASRTGIGGPAQLPMDEGDLLACDLDLGGGVLLPTTTAPLASHALGTGAGLWNAGEDLARFLVSLPRAWAARQAVLEVGCGVAAAPSRALAALGGRAVATDRGEGLLGLTRRNAAAGGKASGGRVAVAALDWAHHGAALAPALALLGRPPTLLLAADVAYDEAAWPALLATLAAGAAAGRGEEGEDHPSAPVLLALPARPESAAFLPAAAAAGWAHRTLRTVPPRDTACVPIAIVQMWLRPDHPADGGGRQTRRAAPYSLLLLDFDWSVVEGNTDTLAVAALGSEAQAALNAATAGGVGWTAAMGAALAAGPAAVAAAGAAGVGMDSEIKAALAAAASCPDTAVVVVSDANDALIAAALGAHGLDGAPDAVITNPAGVGEGGCMTVAPFHGGRAEASPPSGGGDAATAQEKEEAPSAWWPALPLRTPHACQACPPNLCKGAVVEALLATARAPPARVLYLGDGANDACPCLRLAAGGAPGDLVLARRAYPDGRAAPLARALAWQARKGRRAQGGGARVVEWEEAGEAGRAMGAWVAGGGNSTD